MIHRNPTVTHTTYHADTAADVLRRLVVFHPNKHYISTDCSREVPWVAVVVPKQVIEFYAHRCMVFEGWMSLTCLRDSKYGQVEFEIECDLVSVVRDESGGFKVTYEVTGG